MIKAEKIFDKYIPICEKVNSITKKVNSALIQNKKYLKGEKRCNTKESFQCFYVPVILFDSVYRKDGKYYPKVFLEKLIYDFIWRNIMNFGFWNFGSSHLKYKKILEILGIFLKFPFPEI